MQTTTSSKWMAITVALIVIGAIPVFAAKQTEGKQAAAKVTATAKISVTSKNGEAKVIYNGQQVFAGPTTGQVSTRCVSNNGKEYAAAFDGDKVIWENTPGAADQLQKKAGAGSALKP